MKMEGKKWGKKKENLPQSNYLGGGYRQRNTHTKVKVKEYF